MKRILVTGASGFVGSHLLPLIPSERIKITTRRINTSAMDRYASVFVDSIDGRTDWSDVLQDVDCVVHLAGRVHVMRSTRDDERLFHDTNVLGTERLAQAAVANGVRRFIFLSTIKVNGEATAANAFRASDEPKPSDEYSRSKLRAEQALFAVGKSKMDVIVIRPPLVYGPGVRANFRMLLSYIHRNFPLPFGAVRNLRSMVSVWNLCDLIKCTIEAPLINSGVLLVSDGDDISTPRLIRTLAEGMNRKAMLLPVPPRALTLAAALFRKEAQISRLCESLRIDIEETRRKVGWSPPVGVEEGLTLTAKWFMTEVDTRG